MAEVVTVSLSESGATEEALNEKLEDAAFVPHAPVAGVIAAYDEGTTYAKGDLASEGGTVYRSQEDGNEGNKPSEDTDQAHWAVNPTVTYPLARPDWEYNKTTFTSDAAVSKPYPPDTADEETVYP